MLVRVRTRLPTICWRAGTVLQHARRESAASEGACGSELLHTAAVPRCCCAIVVCLC